jgi:predicted AAA+ superfamily ATPase
MTILSINEIENKEMPKQKPVKEVMNKFIPNISDELHIPYRNGFIYVLTGSGGSGKTSLMLNLFKSKVLYRNKFNNIFYFTPESSFLSVEKHVFDGHDKLYHTIDGEALLKVYDQLEDIKKVLLMKNQNIHVLSLMILRTN